MAGDVRHKAASILSLHKLRMLEEVGLTVVDKQRLAALEQVAQSGSKWIRRRHAFHTEIGPSMDDLEAHKKECRVLEREFKRTVNELEAMDG